MERLSGRSHRAEAILMERLACRFHKPKPSLLLPEFSSKPNLGLSTTLPARRLNSGAVRGGGTATSTMTITPASGGPPHQQSWNFRIPRLYIDIARTRT